MKMQTVQVEEPQTVEQLLEQEGLDKTMYFVSVNGAVGEMSTILKDTDEVIIIPAVAGG